MGRKHRRYGKYIHVLTAGLILAASVPGCRDILRPVEDRPPAMSEPHTGRTPTGEETWTRGAETLKRLIESGDFQAALAKCEELLGRTPASGEAIPEILYRKGLIYIHYDNPAKDYRRALSAFRRIVDAHPASGRVEEAKIWIGILDGMEKTRQIDLEIERKKKELNR